MNQFSASAGTITWDDEDERLLWNGTVNLDTPVVIVFQVTVGSNVADGTLISNTTDVRDEAGNMNELGPATTTVVKVNFELNMPLVLRKFPKPKIPFNKQLIEETFWQETPFMRNQN